MTTHKVQCSQTMTNATHAWKYIRNFESDWHPDIISLQPRADTSGAASRVFKGSDGGTYREQITYLSDTDQVLRYALTEGLDGVENYRAEVKLTAQAVHWSAQFDAPEAIAQAVAQGTNDIFNQGLDWLKANASAQDAAIPTVKIPKSKIDRIQIISSIELSALHANQPKSTCSTLVLFLHGIGGNARNWQGQLAALAHTHHAMALDLRGYGQSKLGSQQSRIDDYCDDILSAMKDMGASKLVLVGLSMGSWVAASFAMRYPQLLAGLVLAGGCTGMSEAAADERSRFLQSRAVPLSQGKTPAEFADSVVQVIAGPTATDQQRSTLHESMSAISAETYLDALTCFCNPTERFDYARLECPILLMTGEHDRLASPEEIRQLSLRMHDAIEHAGHLPDIRFEVIPEAGHVCNLERPSAFNHQLLIFLERILSPGVSEIPIRESKRQLKRRRILDAALAVFSEQGFDGASMNDIAKHAGVSKPTLYQYFGDKERLFTTVLAAGCEHIITPLSTPDSSLVDRLWNFSWTYANFVLREDILALARLALGEASRRPDVASIYHQAGPGRAFQGLIQHVQECVDAKQLDTNDVEYAAQDLWSLILSGPRDYHLHFVEKRPDPTDLLHSIGHGLEVFLKIYSTNPTADLEALETKIVAKKSSLASNH